MRKEAPGPSLACTCVREGLGVCLGFRDHPDPRTALEPGVGKARVPRAPTERARS